MTSLPGPHDGPAPRRPRSIVVFGLLLAACAPANDPPAAGRNVLFVVIDTLRSDHLDAYGYPRATAPFLRETAAGGILFEDVTSPCSWTKPAMASLMTSLFPLQHGVLEGNATDTAGNYVSDVLPPGLPVLGEYFARNGYATYAAVRNSHLKAFMGFGRGFETYDEVAGDADDIVASFHDWFASRGGDARPFFAYLHFLDVHAYAPPKEYANLFDTPRLEWFRHGDAERFLELRKAVRSGAMEVPPAEQEGLRLLYDQTIRRTDDVLCALAAWLDARGAWQDTLFVVTSDHGEEFFEHDEFAHGHSMADNLLRVPWILRLPGGRSGGLRLTTPASLLDVMPTLLDLTGIRYPKERMLGRSHAEAIRDRVADDGRERLRYGALYREAAPEAEVFLTQSLRGRRHHFTRTWRPAPSAAWRLRRVAEVSMFEATLRLDHPELYVVQERLYDLERDPGEHVDVAARASPELLRRFHAALARIDQALARSPLPVAGEVELDPETIQDLRETGYIR